MRWVAVAAVLLLAFPVSGQEARGPISIYADEDWLSPTSGRRSGSGTEADPYIVAGWRIERPLVDVRQDDAAIHIENSRAHVILRDLVIEQRFETGLHIQESENIRVEGAAMTGQRVGVRLRDVADIQLQGIDIQRAGPHDGASGILLQDALHINLRDVFVHDGQSLGILATRTSGLTLEAVRVAAHDGGIVLGSDAAVTLRGIEVHGNRGDGILIANVTGLDAKGVVATAQTLPQGLATGRGILAWRSQGTLQGAVAQHNAGDGARLWDGAVDVRDSVFVDNGGHGVVLAQADARATAIEAHGNKGHGIMVFPAALGIKHARLLAVQTHDNGAAGLFVQGLAGLHVDAVRAERNDGAGIDVRGTQNVTLLRALANGNEGSGVLLVEVVGGQVVGADAFRNGEHGFSLRASDLLTLRNNTASANAASGFFLDGHGLQVRHNTAAGNGAFGIDVQRAAQDAVLEGNTLVGNAFGNAPEPRKDTPGLPWFAVLVWLGVARRLSVQRP